ncbi:MAG: hypothetical protein ACRC4W_00215 [Treponemataceae bacterium]
MSNFQTALAKENMIMKAEDLTFGYDAAIANIAFAMQTILSGSNGNYVIGGNVSPYKSGGMNVSVSPIYLFNKTTGCVVETEITEPVSFEASDDSLDRIDVIQIQPIEELFDQQTRMFNDPSTGSKEPRSTDTKKHIKLNIVIKKGSLGSETANPVDEGFTKLAEVRIQAGSNAIDQAFIKNITARKIGDVNEGWTIDANTVFNPGYLAEIFHAFLASHKEDGIHKDHSIKLKNIEVGIESTSVNGNVVPTAKSFNVNGVDFDSLSSITQVVEEMIKNINISFKYTNDIFSRFSFIDDIPVAASTENVDVNSGGEKMIDGVYCSSGQMVFLKDQTNQSNNGLWEVQTGSWNRYAGYTEANPNALTYKFIQIKSGIKNAGKVFYLNGYNYTIGTSQLIFTLSNISPFDIPNTIISRDEAGRARVGAPKYDIDIARLFDVKNYVKKNTATDGIGFNFGNERFLKYAFDQSNNKSIKILAGTHIRLDITGQKSRWLDVETDTVYDLSSQITNAADSSSSRIGEIHGRDFYIYLVPSGDTVDIVVSTNSTFPNDINPSYTAGNTRKIGQFHTLCVDAGSSLKGQKATSRNMVNVDEYYPVKQPKDDEFYNFYNRKVTAVKRGSVYDVVTVEHPLAGFTAGDILPESVFCLTFHPESSADGMCFDPDTGMSVDIYLQSGTGLMTASAFNVPHTATRPHQNHQDDFFQVKKRLLNDFEFASMASGSNEKTAIAGAKDPTVTGGYKDSAGSRMISFIGIESACGALWQWLEESSANGGSGFSTYDGQGDFGQMYGVSYAPMAGGHWHSAASCGSRCRSASNLRSHATAHRGGRGVSHVLRRT